MNPRNRNKSLGSELIPFLKYSQSKPDKAVWIKSTPISKPQNTKEIRKIFLIGEMFSLTNRKQIKLRARNPCPRETDIPLVTIEADRKNRKKLRIFIFILPIPIFTYSLGLQEVLSVESSLFYRHLPTQD